MLEWSIIKENMTIMENGSSGFGKLPCSNLVEKGEEDPIKRGNSSSSFGKFQCPNQGEEGEEGEEDHISF